MSGNNTGVEKNLSVFSRAALRYKAAVLVSSLFFIGYIPIAPGTWASLVACIVIFIFLPTGGFCIPVLAAGLFVVGVISSGMTEKCYGVKDNSIIVIDEALGMLLAVVYLPKTYFVYIGGLLLFRFFDILKPVPIRNIDRNVRGGLGVMLDDVVSGILANIILRLINSLFL